MNNEKASQLREDVANYFTLLKEMLEKDDDMCQIVYGFKAVPIIDGKTTYTKEEVSKLSVYSSLTLQAIMDLGRARVAVDKMLKLIQSED
nr:MAG TPA: hypothetical protein [Caudoviricetes sp.]